MRWTACVFGATLGACAANTAVDGATLSRGIATRGTIADCADAGVSNRAGALGGAEGVGAVDERAALCKPRVAQRIWVPFAIGQQLDDLEQTGAMAVRLQNDLINCLCGLGRELDPGGALVEALQSGTVAITAIAFTDARLVTAEVTLQPPDADATHVVEPHFVVRTWFDGAAWQVDSIANR
jgi:hypothetical protein